MRLDDPRHVRGRGAGAHSSVGRTASRGVNGRFRSACVALAALLLLFSLSAGVLAQPRHGLSAFGELKYPADFKHFDYVNPNAPKGGRWSSIGGPTYDSFNPFIVKGNSALGLGLLFDSLMERALDEPDAVYGVVARAAEVAPDRLSVTFFMRPEARFADGSPVTAEDVVATYQLLKEKGQPFYRFPLRDVTKVEALDKHTVRYTFQGTQLRDLPTRVAGLPILSKAYYATREFDQTTLEPPLGSGPYKIGTYKAGSSVTFVRREDYWAKDLPNMRGRYNFNELRFEYFRERSIELENLFTGAFDYREEFTAKDWATGYARPPVKDGRIKLLTLPDERPSGAQGFFINLRRAKFQDVRVRQALGLAFDYEWTNKNIFFGLYKRTESFFENSDMKAAGKPSAEELALLEPFRKDLPEEVFGEAIPAPVTDGSGQDRQNLREAGRLLELAGYTVKDGRRVNAKGEVLSIEFLIDGPSFERIVAPYQRNLQLLGVQATIRRVDAAQYERRLKSFDFDLVTRRFIVQLVPGVEFRNFFTTGSADAPGSFNMAGIKSPVVDALVEKVIAARNRAELVTATRALDRVLRAGHYWVPHWFKASHNLAFWDRFSWPETKPRYGTGVLDTWWYDAEKAAKIRAN